MDVSADLTELGRTRVAVFCSGAKSILDIPRTLEYLETQGVPVLSFHPDGEFPAFYSPTSGCRVAAVRSVAEAAQAIALNDELGLENGMIFGVPIPREFHAEGAMIERAVEQAVRESIEQGVDRTGKQATPWLLRRVAQLTPHSIRSNVGLVLNNARTAAACAVDLARAAPPRASSVQPRPDAAPAPARVAVVGCAAMDVTAKPSGRLPPQSTAPGHVQLTPGGVALNIATAAQTMLASRGAHVQLIAPWAQDVVGHLLATELRKAQLRDDGMVEAERSATCQLLLDADGQLVAGVADMDAAVAALTPQAVTQRLARAAPRIMAMDANVSVDTMRAVLHHSFSSGTPLLFEPTSVAKCARVVDAWAPLETRARVALMTPNALELAAMAERVRTAFAGHVPVLATQISETAAQLQLPPGLVRDALTLATMAHTQFIKLGAQGVLLVSHDPSSTYPSFVHVPAEPVDRARSLHSTGAGDTMAGAMLACYVAKDMPYEEYTWDDWIDTARLAQRAAVQTLYTPRAVATRLPSVDPPPSVT